MIAPLVKRCIITFVAYCAHHRIQQKKWRDGMPCKDKVVLWARGS